MIFFLLSRVGACCKNISGWKYEIYTWIFSGLPGECKLNFVKKENRWLPNRDGSLFILCVLVFYSLTAVIWRIFPTSQDALSVLFFTAILLGSYTLTMQGIFVIVSIFYGTVLLSRAAQTILLDEVLPRYNIHKGVQLSITRLVHSAILIIGCIILLRVMGAGLTKLTILGGALSIGIGFGLQTIVNNFASGLILLFERPIKVGDTIELGTDRGIVKKLGLRSTIIQTYDNAEIVIPNSDLIAGPVTN